MLDVNVFMQLVYFDVSCEAKRNPLMLLKLEKMVFQEKAPATGIISQRFTWFINSFSCGNMLDVNVFMQLMYFDVSCEAKRNLLMKLTLNKMVF